MCANSIRPQNIRMNQTKRYMTTLFIQRKWQVCMLCQRTSNTNRRIHATWMNIYTRDMTQSWKRNMTKSMMPQSLILENTLCLITDRSDSSFGFNTLDVWSQPETCLWTSSSPKELHHILLYCRLWQIQQVIKALGFLTNPHDLKVCIVL